MIILAIDSGVEKTGYSFFSINKDLPNKFDYITSGLITTKNDVIQRRLKKIYVAVVSLVKRYRPDILVMERLFFFRNQKTVINVSQAQGVIILIAGKSNIKLEFITPLQIKQIITGYGKADKKSVQKMISLILSKKIKIISDDQSDAIACGLAYCYLHINNIE